MSMIGKTLGNFTLEAMLGKGGMGEVYKAKDQKLGRDVAIKVLETKSKIMFRSQVRLFAHLRLIRSSPKG